MSVVSLRLGRWFNSSAGESETGADPMPGRDLTQRKLYDDIGDFLFAHRLAVSDRNFAVAHAYLGGDRDVGRSIENLLRAGQGLSDAALWTIADGSPTLAAKGVSDVADQLNDKLAECLRIIGRSSAFARDFGEAVDQEATGVAADPLGTAERLLALSREVVTGTHALEAELDRARSETERLRSHLTRARREADHDHLTGLLNRRSFENRLASLPLVPDPTTPRCIALCDIDRFKVINDEHGHDAGDRVLRYFARRLRTLINGRAVVARYGGEEFACLFDGMALHDVTAALDEIRSAIAARPLVSRSSGRPMPPLTFSAGIAPLLGDPRDALAVADRALYDAKHAGRNRVVARST